MSERVDVHQAFSEQGNRAAEEIAARAVRDPRTLDELFEAASSPAKKVKNAAGKALRIVSEVDAASLYPRLGRFVALMDGDDTILKWLSIDIVGNLSFVDTERRVDDKVVQRFLALARDDALVTAAHAVDNLWKLAVNEPQHRKVITQGLLRVDSVSRRVDCRSILAGKVLVTFGRYYDSIADRRQRNRIVSYAKDHLDDPRSATRKKAAAFLKRHAAL